MTILQPCFCTMSTKSSVSMKHTVRYEDEESLDNQINSYFHQVRSVVEMIDELKLQVTEVHSKEFIANPKATLRRLCLTLHIDCSGEYLHMCAERTFASESHSRSLVKWTPSLIDKVHHNMQKYKHLQRYSFCFVFFVCFFSIKGLCMIQQRET